MVSYYQVLGVHENSSHEEIKQAYRQRMKAHHSDRHGQDDDPIVRLIAEAYDVLSNPAKRRRYDEELREEKNEDFSSTAFQPRQSTQSFTTMSRPFSGRPFRSSPWLQSQPTTPQAQSRARELCRRCGGRGYNPVLGVSWSCDYCNGQGWVPGKIAL